MTKYWIRCSTCLRQFGHLRSLRRHHVPGNRLQSCAFGSIHHTFHHDSDFFASTIIDVDCRTLGLLVNEMTYNPFYMKGISRK